MNVIEEIVKLRHTLHQQPELSGVETETANRIISFLETCKPDKIYNNVFGEAIIAEFAGKEKGPTLLFRCDMDAVPVNETSKLEYRSTKHNISHACGHDGHMAIVTGLACRLNENPIKKGKVLLFYQPAEENGEGAKGSIDSFDRLGINPDYAFAIHNLPGYPKGSIILSKYSFSASSKGLTIKLYGIPSHAAYPENGINPAQAVAEIIQALLNVTVENSFSKYVLTTIINVQLGEQAFGISPSNAVIRATLRAYDNRDMDNLTNYVTNLIQSIANKFKLTFGIDFSEIFPASECDPKLTDLIERISIQLGRNLIYLDKPNRWSEDFAHFTIKYPAIIFGIGAGENHPNLHTSEYDFPDDLIESGIIIMDSIVDSYLR